MRDTPGLAFLARTAMNVKSRAITAIQTRGVAILWVLLRARVMLALPAMGFSAMISTNARWVPIHATPAPPARIRRDRFPAPAIGDTPGAGVNAPMSWNAPSTLTTVAQTQLAPIPPVLFSVPATLDGQEMGSRA